MGVYNNSNIISTNSYNKEYIDKQINNIKEDLSNKANKSTNIADYGITDSINYGNITNCVVETPDNINLTLSKEGELNLKAGSIIVLTGELRFWKNKICSRNFKIFWFRK